MYISEEPSRKFAERNEPWGIGTVDEAAEILVDLVKEDDLPRFTTFNTTPLDAWPGETVKKILDRWNTLQALAGIKHRLDGRPNYFHVSQNEDIRALLEIIDASLPWPYKILDYDTSSSTNLKALV